MKSEYGRFATLVFLLVLHLELHASDVFKNYWYNQGAEITTYELKQSRYGEEREGYAVFVFVTEPFHTKQHVKSDNPNDPLAVPILKLNATRNFFTGIYPYSVMSSIFAPINSDQGVLKVTTSVQEWCGHVFEQWNRREDGWHHEQRSYFQSEGDSNVSHGRGLLEDELWTMIRLKPESIPIGRNRIIPGSVYRRFYHRPPAYIEASIAVSKVDSNFKRVEVVYPKLNRKLSIVFEDQFPHKIKSWEEKGPRGTTTAVARHLTYGPYWEWNNKASGKKRAELGLPLR